jgi:F420-dependent oxidoreductase-like protein
MKLAMMINYVGDFPASAQQVVELEKVGLDMVWVAEAYSFDAISQIGYLAAVTKTVRIGTGIVNVYSRTPALMAMTAAGCDYVSGGRFMLGLGASGAQVIEGFHGMPYDKPMQRTREYIEVCREVWRREKPLEFHGKTVDVPLPAGQGIGLGKPLKLINHPVRNEIPVWWASVKDKSVESTGEIADGWMPIFVWPEKMMDVWGEALNKGLAKRSPALAPLEIQAGGMLAIDDSLVGEDQRKVLDFARPSTALYVGGMGARGKNFYNDICKAYGFEREAVEIQDLYLDGRKDDAAKAVPNEWLLNSHLVGSRGFVKDRLAAYKEAGVTVLQVNPIGPNALQQVELLRSLIDEL